MFILSDDSRLCTSTLYHYIKFEKCIVKISHLIHDSLKVCTAKFMISVHVRVIYHTRMVYYLRARKQNLNIYSHEHHIVFSHSTAATTKNYILSFHDFSKIYFHIESENLALSCTTVALTSQVPRAAKLVLLIVRY